MASLAVFLKRHWRQLRPFWLSGRKSSPFWRNQRECLAGWGIEVEVRLEQRNPLTRRRAGRVSGLQGCWTPRHWRTFKFQPQVPSLDSLTGTGSQQLDCYPARARLRNWMRHGAMVFQSPEFDDQCVFDRAHATFYTVCWAKRRRAELMPAGSETSRPAHRFNAQCAPPWSRLHVPMECA